MINYDGIVEIDRHSLCFTRYIGYMFNMICNRLNIGHSFISNEERRKIDLGRHHHRIL